MPKKKTWERRAGEAKHKDRPKLKDWEKDGFATFRYGDFCRVRDETLPVRMILTKSQLEDETILSDGLVPRIDTTILSIEDFVTHIEAPAIPCTISNIPADQGWLATRNWNHSTLRMQYKDRLFKVGEDDKGYKVKMKMKHFLQYLQNTTDDSPLYIFDGNYDNDSVSKGLLNEYRVPKYFPDDLFRLVGEDRRPPYRWFLIGPARSGSMVHIDPLGTSAWNTLVQGRKRWVLFPPDTPRSIAKGLDVILKGEDDEAVNYFVDILPRIKKRYGARVKIFEFVQEPGETVFVPGGWWHSVLNIEHTVAITQNFCSRTNFDAVWRKTRSGRKKMSVKWLRKLHDEYPDLADRAERINDADRYVMYDKEKHGKQKKKDSKKEGKDSKSEQMRERSMSSSSSHGREMEERGKKLDTNAKTSTGAMCAKPSNAVSRITPLSPISRTTEDQKLGLRLHLQSLSQSDTSSRPRPYDVLSDRGRKAASDSDCTEYTQNAGGSGAADATKDTLFLDDLNNLNNLKGATIHSNATSKSTSSVSSETSTSRKRRSSENDSDNVSEETDRISRSENNPPFQNHDGKKRPKLGDSRDGREPGLSGVITSESASIFEKLCNRFSTYRRSDKKSYKHDYKRNRESDDRIADRSNDRKDKKRKEKKSSSSSSKKTKASRD